MKILAAYFLWNETAATSIEYGLIAALMSLVCIAGMVFVGNQLQALYNAISAAITPAL